MSKLMNKRKIKKIDLIGVASKARISIKIPKDVWELAKTKVDKKNKDVTVSNLVELGLLGLVKFENPDKILPLEKGNTRRKDIRTSITVTPTTRRLVDAFSSEHKIGIDAMLVHTILNILAI